MTGRQDDQNATPYRTATVGGALDVMDFGAPIGFRLVLQPPERLTALVTQNAPLYPKEPRGWWATLDLLYDTRGDGPTFEVMQQFLRDRQPPALVAAGVNDEIFPGEVQWQILTDLPGAEFHPLDTGHFALEDQAPEIARLTRDFLGRVLAPGFGS